MKAVTLLEMINYIDANKSKREMRNGEVHKNVSATA
jgi:hypothetical protein